MSKQSFNRKETGQDYNLHQHANLSLRCLSVGFIVVVFLAQAFGIMGFLTPEAAQAISGRNDSIEGSSAGDPIPPTPFTDKHKSLSQSNVGISGAEELQKKLEQSRQLMRNAQSKAVDVTQPAWGNPTAKDSVPSPNAVGPRLFPLFNPLNIYYANVTADDSGIDTSAHCNTSSNATCSLRSAITRANADAHGSGNSSLVKLTASSTYTLTSQLPAITNFVYISSTSDGSCPAKAATPFVSGSGSGGSGFVLSSNDFLNGFVSTQFPVDSIIINGSFNKLSCIVMDGAVDALHINPGGTNNRVGGLNSTAHAFGFNVEIAIGFSGNGVVITGTGTVSNTVQNAGIGYVPGFGVAANSKIGISIGGGASNNTIGGNLVSQRNVIGKNGSAGIAVTEASSTGNKIIGNYIGVNETGQIAEPDGTFGLFIQNATNTQVGGDSVAGYGNLIDAEVAGVCIVNSSNNNVQGNIIGPNSTFSGALGNTYGILLDGGATNNTIGGEEDTTAHLGNTVSGNQFGIVSDQLVSLNVVGTNNFYGNRVGTDLTGSTAISNTMGGIYLIQSSDNKIGGGGPGQSNLISGNGGSGVIIVGTITTTNNIIQGNHIGVTGDLSGPLYNGTTSGADNTCSPGSSNLYSENCNGVWLLSNSTSVAGPSGNTIGGDSRVGLGNIIAADYIGATRGNQYGASAISLDAASGNTIQGNSIGAYINGSTVISYPTNVGISLINGSSNDLIGGDSSLGQGNLVAASIYNAIQLHEQIFGGGSGVSGPMNGNKIQGNAVTVDFAGNTNASLSAIGGVFGASYGLEIINYVPTQTLSSNLIGIDYNVATPNPNQANLIGNQIAAIYMSGVANNNQISGNDIGVNAAKSASNSGSRVGVALSSGPTNTKIMSNTIGAANLSNTITSTISGLFIAGPITGTQVSGNYIGTNVSDADFHTGVGVIILVEASQTLLKQNVIAHNQVEGVLIGFSLTDSKTKQNTISQNSIFANNGFGINLNYTITNPVGILGGADTGPNNQAQKPTLTTANFNPANFTAQASGTANPNSIVEVFLGSSTGVTTTQGITYLGTANADASGNFNFNGPLPAGLTIPANGVLVTTSTLNDPAFPGRVGSTSQFSAPLTATVLPVLNVSPTSIVLSGTIGTSFANQSVTLNATYASLNYTSTTSYQGGASAWLTVTPASGSVTPGTPTTVTFSFNTATLAKGVYTATVSFFNTSNPQDPPKTVTVTLNLNSYSYYLPFLSNGLNSFTTYPVFQNVGSSSANVSITFYDSSGNTLGTQPTLTGTCNPVPQNGECILPNPYSATSTGSAIIVSSQPLNVIIPESTTFGGSAYAISGGANGALIVPIALNNSFGDFKTQILVYNGGSSAASVTIKFYNNDGSAAAVNTTQNFSINPRTSQSFDQSATSSNLPSGFTGWAQITGNDANSQTLVAQVLEQSASRKFVAIANAQATASSTVYAPAIFNVAYGSFTTGANIVNPGSSPVTVTVSYYTVSGAISTTAPFSLNAHAVAGVFQGAPGGNGIPAGGFPVGYIGAATVTASGGGIVMVVNEDGGLTGTGNERSGTYAAASSGSERVGLPVIANGAFGGYVTGDTIQNTSNATVSGSISYYNLDGTPVGTSQSFSIGPNASQAYYQGSGAGLPSGFYGTAVVTESSGPANALIVTTNAQNNSLFYTYVEPAS